MKPYSRLKPAERRSVRRLKKEFALWGVAPWVTEDEFYQMLTKAIPVLQKTVVAFGVTVDECATAIGRLQEAMATP